MKILSTIIAISLAGHALADDTEALERRVIALEEKLQGTSTGRVIEKKLDVEARDAATWEAARIALKYEAKPEPKPIWKE